MIQEAESRVPPGKRILFIAIAALVVLALVELAAFGAGLFLQRMFKIYKVPVVQRGERIKSYEDYLRERDPRLGWPYPSEFGGPFFDRSGARHSPAFRDPQKFPNAVSIFGDSYAAGSEVDDEHAWGNQLASLIGTRVGIFGVPGYGTDQAYLRFLSMDKDPARVVILTHLSEDITRNLTRDWDLFTGLGYYALKPRFALDSRGGLREVPLPNLTEREYLRSVGIESPFLPMEDENFQPGGPAGVTWFAFPYSVALARNMFGYQMRSVLAHRPEYVEFYWKGHPAGGLEITAGILESFQREARARGKWPLVVLLATRRDLAYHRRSGQWTYAPLVEALERAHVNYLDFGPVLLEHVGNRDILEFFKPLGHYNEEASRLLAETVRDALGSRGALP